uniref:Uncharacterized protein n=1 Tax=Rhizophora mucronata TaxID=61149 RepID=A0A2P2Q037_RHIMU
MFVFLFMPIFI